MLEFESKLASALGNTIKFKVTDPEVMPKFLYYWVQNLYNSGKITQLLRGSVIQGAAIRELKALPFYNKTLGDVANISTSLEDYDFEMNRVGTEAGKLVQKTASHYIEAAASEAKKDALSTKYKLSKEELNFIADELDPTPNGVYTDWLCKAYKYYLSHNDTPSNLKADMEGKLQLFEKLKNSPQWRLSNQTDINRYDVIHFLHQMELAQKSDLSKKERERDLEQNKDKYALEGSQLLGETGPFRVYKVTTVEASRVLSMDTHWCTKGEGHASHYLKMAPLFVVTTPGENNEDYASDKFCQIFVPRGKPDRIECQDIHGDDLGDQMDDGYVVTRPEFWELFLFIAKFDPTTREYIADHTICDSEEDYWEHREKCPNCDKEFRQGDGVYDERTQESYCTESCFKEANEEYIKETVYHLLKPFEEQVNADSEKAVEDFKILLTDPASPLANYFKKIHNAVVKANEKRSIPITPEEEAQLQFHLSNVNSALRATPARRAEVFPDLSVEELEEAKSIITPLYDRSAEDFDALVDIAVSDVLHQFSVSNTDIKGILEKEQYLNPDGSFHDKEASWNNGLLNKDAAASEAKKNALATKYKLDPVLVETLSNIDPTPNGEYTDWLCKSQSKGEIASSGVREDYITAALQRFSILKRPGTPFRQTNSGDINTYTVTTLVRAMEAATTEDMSKKEQERKRKEDIEKNKQKYLTEGSEYIGEVEGGYLCFRVTTMQASEILGANTHWCTRGTNYGPGYLAMAPLYIFTTPGKEFDSHYTDDKYLQIFVPEDPGRIEAQLASGRDIGHNLGGGYWVRDNGESNIYWKFFEFLTHHDERIKEFVEQGIISDNKDDIPNDEATCDNCGGDFEARDLNEHDGDMLCDDCYADTQREYCPRCDESYDSDDMHYLQATGESYCDDCWDEARDEFIKETIESLFQPYADVIEKEEAKETAKYGVEAEKAKKEWHKLVTSPGTPLKAYFEATNKAIDIFNETNPNNLIDKKAVSEDIKWQLSSINGALQVGDARRERLYPGVPREVFEEAAKIIKPLIEKINEEGEADFRDGAFDYVQGEFESSFGRDDIKRLLVQGGYLNADGSFKIDAPKLSRLKTAAVSQAKQDALVKKYSIPESVVLVMSEMDPTPNGEYTDWLCREFKNKRLKLRSIINPTAPSQGDVSALLQRFTMLKRPGTPFRQLNSADINQYHYESLANAIEASTREDLSKNEQKKELERQKEKYITEGSEVVSRKGDLALYRITTPEASVLLSKGTHWCTQGEGTARNYLESGPLYVIVKDAPVETRMDYERNNYNQKGTSDRLVQIYCPDLDYIECQDTDGRDIGDNIYVGDYGEDVQAYWISDDTNWAYMQWVAEHDSEVGRLVKGGFIYHDTKDLIDDLTRTVWKTAFGATLLEDVKRQKPEFTLTDSFKLCPTWLDSLWGYDESDPSGELSATLYKFGITFRTYDSLLFIAPEPYQVLIDAIKEAGIDPERERVLGRGLIFNNPKQISWDYIDRSSLVDEHTLLDSLLETWKIQDMSDSCVAWVKENYPTCHHCGKPIFDPVEVLVRSGDNETFCSDTCYDADTDSENPGK